MTLAIWSLLAWNHTHGGVPSHHILAREDLPSFSNWWGGLLLPALSWFLLSRIQKRVPGRPIPSNIIYGFVGALVYGILLATFSPSHRRVQTSQTTSNTIDYPQNRHKVH